MPSHTHSAQKPTIAFIHIPKTAGQSIHHWISQNYSKEEICPARTNRQLHDLPLTSLRKYKFFSGHLDWNILKALRPFDYTFSVIRQPKDRIISFYFYMAKEAKRFKSNGDDLPLGLEMALLPIDKYFENENEEYRIFINNHYNNFYSYFFSSGSYNGYQRYGNKKGLSDAKIIQLAIETISCDYDEIFSMNQINSIPHILRKKFNFTGEDLTNINKNDEHKPLTREQSINSIASEAKWDWNKKLREFTRMDDILYDHLAGKNRE